MNNSFLFLLFVSHFVSFVENSILGHSVVDHIHINIFHGFDNRTMINRNHTCNQSAFNNCVYSRTYWQPIFYSKGKLPSLG